MSKRPLLIYRDFLLYPSETFIKSQSEGLERFEPSFVGLQRVDGGIALDPRSMFLIQGRSQFRRADNVLFGFAGVSVRLMAHIARTRPALLHAHFGVDGSRVARTANVCQLPMLVTLHDYDVTTSDADLVALHRSNARYIARRPYLQRTATRFIAVSEFLKRKAIARGFPEDRIQVHYIGVDVDRFVPSLPATRDDVVLFVGRLVEKKGCRYLIEAMNAVQREFPRLQLVVIGDGPLRSELETKSRQTLSRFQFLGKQSHAQVCEWFMRARLFCLPSVTAKSGETEGLPIAILEAMASEVPIVATRHAGIPEAVVHQETGLLTTERNSEDLTRQILTILREPALASRLASAASAHVRQRFNLRQQNRQLETIYEEVAAARKS